MKDPNPLRNIDDSWQRVFELYQCKLQFEAAHVAHSTRQNNPKNAQAPTPQEFLPYWVKPKDLLSTAPKQTFLKRLGLEGCCLRPDQVFEQALFNAYFESADLGLWAAGTQFPVHQVQETSKAFVEGLNPGVIHLWTQTLSIDSHVVPAIWKAQWWFITQSNWSPPSSAEAHTWFRVLNK